MEIAVEKLVALCCIVVGLSHILQPRAWVRLFIRWRETGDAGAFYTALLHLPLGVFVVAFHNVWHGTALVVTLLGWSWTVKGTLYLIYPKHALRMLSLVSPERAHHFVIGGVFLLLLGLFVASSIYLR